MTAPRRPTPLHLFGQFCILAAVKANYAAFVWDNGGRTPGTHDMRKPGYERFAVPQTYADDQLQGAERP